MHSPEPPIDNGGPPHTVQEPPDAAEARSHNNNEVSEAGNPAEETSLNEPGEGPDAYHMCPSCVVEGRSCECGNMLPKQQFPFDDLVTQRNEAAKLISGLVPLDNR